MKMPSDSSSTPGFSMFGGTSPKKLARTELSPDELRKFDRTDYTQPVRVDVCGPDGKVVDQGWAQVVDISPNGVRLRGLRLIRQTELTENHRIVLDIVFEDGNVYAQARSMPRWVDEDGDLGLEFETIDVHVA